MDLDLDGNHLTRGELSAVNMFYMIYHKPSCWLPLHYTPGS